MALMDTLRRISQQYGEGLMAERLGPDWRQKRELLSAQTEGVRAGTERDRAATGQAQSATAEHEHNLQRAREEYESVKKLVAAGKLPSTDLRVAEYDLRKLEAEARMANDMTTRGLHRAQARYYEGNTLTPEQKAEDWRNRQGLIKAQTGYYGAGSDLRERTTPGAKTLSKFLTGNEATALQQQAEDNVKGRQPSRIGNFLKSIAGFRGMKPEVTPGLEEGSAEWMQEVEAERQKLIKERSVQLHYDPKTGQSRWQIGSGFAPASPEAVTAAGGSPFVGPPTEDEIDPEYGRP